MTATRGAGAGLEGRVRISAPLTFSRLHLAPKLGEFLDVKVRALELLMDDRIVYGVAVNIDAELRFGELTDSALHAPNYHRRTRWLWPVRHSRRDEGPFPPLVPPYTNRALCRP